MKKVYFILIMVLVTLLCTTFNPVTISYSYGDTKQYELKGYLMDNINDLERNWIINYFEEGESKFVSVSPRQISIDVDQNIEFPTVYIQYDTKVEFCGFKGMNKMEYLYKLKLPLGQ